MKKPSVLQTIAWIVAIGCVAYYFLWPRGVAPPVPTNLAQLDPDVADYIQKASAAVKQSKRDIQRRIVLGKVYEANTLHELAIQTYGQVLEQDPNLAEIWFRQAVCHERLGDLEQAVQSMDQSIALKADFAASHWRNSMWLLDIGEIDKAAAAADQATTLAKSESSAWFAQAKVHLAKKENQQAIDVIQNHGLTTSSNGPFANFLIGRAYQQMGQLDKAAPYLQEREFRPGWRDDWTRELVKYQTGLARMRASVSGQVKRGKFAEAIKVLEKIVERDPKDRRSLNMLGVCYLQTQQWQLSLDTLKRSLEVDPESLSTNLNLSAALMTAHSLGNVPVSLAEAMQYADKAAAIMPLSASAQEARGKIFRLMSKPDDAIKAFEKAYELDSRTPARAILAVSVEMSDSRYEAALARLDKLKETSSDHASVHVAVAGYHAARGEFPEALKAMETASKAPIASAMDRKVIAQRIQQFQALVRQTANPQESP